MTENGFSGSRLGTLAGAAVEEDELCVRGG